MADYPKLKKLDEYGKPKKREKRPELAPIPWPKIGDTFVDSVGRTLVVLEINLTDGIGRNIVGTVNGVSYSCDKLIFDAVWILDAQVVRPSV